MENHCTAEISRDTSQRLTDMCGSQSGETSWFVVIYGSALFNVKAGSSLMCAFMHDVNVAGCGWHALLPGHYVCVRSGKMHQGRL